MKLQESATSRLTTQLSLVAAKGRLKIPAPLRENLPRN